MKFEESPYSPYGVYSFYKDKKENLWFGTLSAGVFRFDGDEFLWIAEKELTAFEDGRVPGIRSIIEDKDGKFWLSNILHQYDIIETEKGKTKYKKIEVADKPSKITLPYFMSAVTDNEQGDLWMVSYSEGVWKYDGKKLTQHLIKDGKIEVLLFSIYKDHEGGLWLGTHNAGIYKYDGNGFKKFKL